MSEDKPKPASTLRRIHSFVRRQGRMTASQQQALQSLWPQYGLSLPEVVDFKQAFAREAPTVLDIGFGMGESLFELAQANAQLNFIGIDVHRPGVGGLVNRVDKAGLENVRVFCADAIEVLQHCIPEQSLAAVLLFFPDPWPKQRHQKRRIVQPEFVQRIATKLKSDGQFHLSTDWEDYAQHIQAVMAQSEDFTACSQHDRLFNQRPSTKYERRGQRLGHQIWDLVYRKQ